MQRVTIPDVMEKMILEIQAENPLLDKPIDVIKIAMTDFYRKYKMQGSIQLDTQNEKQVASQFWSTQAKKPNSKPLSQKEIDKLSYVS